MTPSIETWAPMMIFRMGHTPSATLAPEAAPRSQMLIFIAIFDTPVLFGKIARGRVDPRLLRSSPPQKQGEDPMFRTALIAAPLLLASLGCATTRRAPEVPMVPAVAEARVTSDRVAINGMQMYYEVSGQGDPLIVLHGAYMNIPTMGAIIPALAKTHRVYALELQGHGRTTDIDRPITYAHLADDVAAFMDSVGLKKADVFGYSMGSIVGLQLAIRHPAKVTKLAAASVAYDVEGWQPEFKAVIPELSVEMMLQTPFANDYKKLAPNPNGFPELARKLIALEKEPMAWAADVKALKLPVLIVTSDADVATLEHSVAMFRLLGGGVMGDMGKPLPTARLAVLPATSHTAVIMQPRLLHAFIEPFLKGEIPKGMFQ
jgi:pimeloyl-ACP methyl ester carboxylesterase